MDSVTDEWALPHPGSPIRTSSDGWLLAAPRALSQLATSFVASRRQGIHRSLLVACPRTCFSCRDHRLATVEHLCIRVSQIVARMTLPVPASFAPGGSGRL